MTKRKTISFSSEYEEEYEHLTKMEEKYGNASRYIVLLIRRDINNKEEK